MYLHFQTEDVLVLLIDQNLANELIWYSSGEIPQDARMHWCESFFFFGTGICILGWIPRCGPPGLHIFLIRTRSCGALVSMVVSGSLKRGDR